MQRHSKHFIVIIISLSQLDYSSQRISRASIKGAYRRTIKNSKTQNVSFIAMDESAQNSRTE